MSGSAGTLLGEVGTALEDLQAVSHDHTLAAEASATTTSVAVAHTHGSGSYTTGSAGAHNHRWLDGFISYSSTGSALPLAPAFFQSGSNMQVNLGTNSEHYTNNGGSHTHSMSGTSGAASSTSHSHAVDLGGQPVGAATSSLPYLQLLACQRA